ncbi:unnamed protein product [Schistocephalus solidus]|uniref:Myo-inositol-1(Or 4)-monophosphatase n=1 Tax=Schistocephalus solidus TaxID=70667 RepID=A0A183T9C1_SCHSO|nr:unnamed protein product [Schistocephalus solidus]
MLGYTCRRRREVQLNTWLDNVRQDMDFVLHLRYPVSVVGEDNELNCPDLLPRISPLERADKTFNLSVGLRVIWWRMQVTEQSPKIGDYDSRHRALHVKDFGPYAICVYGDKEILAIDLSSVIDVDPGPRGLWDRPCMECGLRWCLGFEDAFGA